MSNTEQRLDDLEMKVAFQEDTIESLNNEIALLNELIDRQRTQLEYLANKLGEISQAPMGAQLPEPPPPHY
ncbi:MAG: SlyX family protein [Psychrobium sp.]